MLIQIIRLVGLHGFEVVESCRGICLRVVLTYVVWSFRQINGSTNNHGRNKSVCFSFCAVWSGIVKFQMCSVCVYVCVCVCVRAHTCTRACVCMFVCACACVLVCERERERERAGYWNFIEVVLSTLLTESGFGCAICTNGYVLLVPAHFYPRSQWREIGLVLQESFIATVRGDWKGMK